MHSKSQQLTFKEIEQLKTEALTLNDLPLNECCRSFPNNLLASSKKITVSITGASGYLGLVLTNQLYNNPNITKIYAFYNKNLPTIPDPQNKITFVKSDLCKSNPENIILDKLSDSDIYNIKHSDLLIHSAAKINSIAPLTKLYTTNVHSCINIHKFFDKDVPVAYISSLSVFASSSLSNPNVPTYCKPTHTFSKETIFNGGYSASKILAEQLFMSLKRPVKILRLGLLTPPIITTDTLLTSLNNSNNLKLYSTSLFTNYLHNIHALINYHNSNKASINKEISINITPLNYACLEIVNSLCTDELISHISYSNLLLEDFVSVLKKLSQLENVNQIDLPSSKLSNTLLLNTFNPPNIKDKYFNINLFQSTNLIYTKPNNHESLDKKAIQNYLVSFLRPKLQELIQNNETI